MVTESQSMSSTKANTSALRTPGDELRRHNLTMYLIRHPDILKIFKAEEQLCRDDETRAALILRWHSDLMKGSLIGIR